MATANHSANGMRANGARKTANGKATNGKVAKASPARGGVWGTVQRHPIAAIGAVALGVGAAAYLTRRSRRAKASAKAR